MKKLFSYLKNTTIQKQIQFTVILVSVLSTLLLGCVSFLIFKQTIEKNYKEDFEYSLETSNRIIAIQLKEILSLSRGLLTNENVNEVLTSEAMTGTETFSGEQMKILQSELNKMVYGNAFIAEATLIDESGRSYSIHKNLGFVSRINKESVMEEPWFEEVKASKGREVFFTGNVLDTEKSEAVFSMGKQLNDIGSNKTNGYLVINIRRKILDEIFGYNGNTADRTNFFIVGSDGKEAYFTGDETQKDKIFEEFNNPDDWNNKYIFTETDNNILEWQLVSVIPGNDLLGDSIIIGWEMLGLIIVIIIVGTLLSRLISNRIYQPLRQLSIMIHQVGRGERKLTETFEIGEIGEIGEQFKEMVNNNLELRENLLVSQVKEREAELLLLQAQINPHFLYNTLDSIYCKAIIEEEDQIAEMVENLSRMFRLSLSKGNKIVPVSDEIAHITSYMNIQNHRFNHRFLLDLDIPEELTDMPMLKFVLQPFVENAMYHGLEPKVGIGHIRVSATIRESYLIFEVEDDGVGMKDVSLAYKGYGIRNVRERIKLYYGDDGDVSFESYEGVGTKVTIRLLLTVEKEDNENV